MTQQVGTFGLEVHCFSAHHSAVFQTDYNLSLSSQECMLGNISCKANL